MANNDSAAKEQDLEKKGSPTPFIDASTAKDAYEESYKWFVPYFDPIAEFERIARNKPSDKISPELPRITDGTMAAIIQEDPKRVIQQVPTGQIKCRDYPEYAKLADIVLFKDLIPMYNRMGDMLQKSWNMLGKAMTWGRATSYTFFTQTDGVLHTDFVIPYVKDVLSEKGKVFAPDSNISFMRSWYQKRDLQAIINREKMFMDNIEGYVSDWNLKWLSDFMEAGASAKPADLQTAAEREKGDGYAGGYEVIHAFQKGIGAQFYSFAPRFNDGKPMRTKSNKDPRGAMPLDHLYCNIDLSNPLGRGQVELSGGIQNLIDQQMQMFQFLTTVLMGPPLQVWGSVNQKSLKYRPNAIWHMGNNTTNKVEPIAINNEAIQNFPNNYGLLKSQIFNLNSSQDHSISATDGNPAQSKTQAGVQAAESRLGISDNYLRKQYESWFQAQSETSTNVYFAEMTGEKKILLDPAELKDIMKTPAKKYLVEGKSELRVPYRDIANTTFRFKVDASTSQVKENADNAEKLTEVVKVMQTSQDPTVLKKIPQVVKLIIDEIGAEGTDDLFPELDETGPDGQPAQPQQPQQPQMTPDMVVQLVQQTVMQAMQAQPQEDPLLRIFDKLPEDVKQQVLQKYGYQTDTASPTQQNVEIAAAKASLDISNAAHQQTMDTHNAVMTAMQPAQTPGNDQPASGSTNSPKSQQNAPDQANDPNRPLDPDEQSVVQALLQSGFTDQDAEQAIMMLRQGLPQEDVLRALGAKYAQR